MEEILYQYWLMKNEDVPYGKKAKLVDYFYNSFNIFNATKSELLNSRLLDEKQVEIFINKRKHYELSQEFEEFIKTGFSFVTMENELYPEKLRNIYDIPYGFYYLGKLTDFRKSVAIVGARRCSAYGKRMALELGKRLGENGFTVISGMARGIDAYGHRGCLDGSGKTVAVLGSGCDVIYPHENRLLYEEIVKSGGNIISEYQMGTSPIPMNFPRRNRIVSALSDKVVVIEAREKSGSLITADFALDQGKDIYVTPGRVSDTLSFGANKLIAQGAGVIYDLDTFINELLDEYGEKQISKHCESKKQVKLSNEQMEVYNLFDDYPKSISTVIEETKMDYLKLLSIVLSLERNGFITEVFKNNYTKTA